jgi:hypothetical protein
LPPDAFAGMDTMEWVPWHACYVFVWVWVFVPCTLLIWGVWIVCWIEGRGKHALHVIYMTYHGRETQSLPHFGKQQK